MYRADVYQAETLEKRVFERSSIDALIDSASTIFERTITENQRDDGLFQTYNLLKTENGADLDFPFIPDARGTGRHFKRQNAHPF